MSVRTVREAIEALNKLDPDLEVLELKVSFMSPSDADRAVLRDLNRFFEAGPFGGTSLRPAAGA